MVTASRTPSPLAVEAQSHESSIQILERVSRMTLEAPDSPPLPNFKTPQIRKRSFSFVVTPPKLNVKNSTDVNSDEISSCCIPCEYLLPLLPDSFALDESSSAQRNRFARHRPMHSPLEGVSTVNPNYLLNLEEKISLPSPSINPRPRLTAFLHAPFPDLEEEDACRPSGTIACTRALKMRRHNNDDLSLFTRNLL